MGTVGAGQQCGRYNAFADPSPVRPLFAHSCHCIAIAEGLESAHMGTSRACELGPRCPASPQEARCRSVPDRLPARPCSLTALSRPCPRRGPESLADGFRPPALRSPEGPSPVRRLAPVRRAATPVLSLVEGLNSKDRR
jgi:hypothetical protein